VALEFASSPYVIGYELMNEPWAGDVYEEPSLLIPGAADRNKLQQLYDDAAASIREVDREHLVLFQGVTWEVVVPIGEKHGFTHAPGGDQFANKSALTWHCSVLPDVTPEDLYFSWKRDEMQRLGVGGYVTEVVGDSGRCDILDKYKISWMQFSFKSMANLTWDNTGLFLPSCSDPASMQACLNVPEVKVWARTYAKAVAGTTSSFSFNSSSREASLRFRSSPSCAEPTVLFASEQWTYPQGLTVHVSPAGMVAWEFGEGGKDRSHIVVTVSSSEPVDVTVDISPLA
jgi:endoglycosylceramidase